MIRKEEIFANPEVAKILSVDDIVLAFQRAIIGYVWYGKNNAVRMIVSAQGSGNGAKRSFDYDRNLAPLTTLLVFLDWQKQTLFSDPLKSDLYKFKDVVIAKNLFDAVHVALESWRNNFFRIRKS